MSSAPGDSGAPESRRRVRKLTTVAETSAGGLTVNTDHTRAAVIGRTDRRGKLLWSLPKGHIEAGESPAQTAVREVAEETGVTGEVLAPLGTIDYWFIAGGHKVHKTVHHFLLEWRSGELCDEDIEVTEVAWVALDELEGLLAYPDERRLLRLATRLLAGDGRAGGRRR
ncbi:MAG: NUDIX hydrolase, partial [Sciscionella sp.]